MPWFGDNYIGPALPETKLVDDGTGKKVPMNYPYKISVKKEGVPRQPSPELVEQARKWYGGDLYVPSSWSPHMTASDGYEQTPSSMPPPKVEVQGQPAPIKVDGPPQQQPPPYVEKPKPMEVGRLEEMMAAKEAANKIMGASHTNPVVMGGGPTINGKQPSLPPQWAKTPGLGPKTTQPIDHEAVNQSLADDFEKFRIKTYGLMNAPVWQTPVVGPDTPSSMMPRPVNPAEGYNRALQAFASMRGLGEKQVSADTARGELGQKEVSNRLAEKNLTELEPQKILAGLAGEEMKGKYGLQQAEIQRKTVSQQGLNETIKRMREEGKSGDEILREIENWQNTDRAMRGDDPMAENYGYGDAIRRNLKISGGTRPIQVTGPGGVTSPGQLTPPKKTAEQARQEIKTNADNRMGKLSSQEFLRRVGMADEKGSPTGKYDYEQVMKQLLDSPDAIDDSVIDALVTAAAKANAGSRDQLATKALKDYMKQSRMSGNEGGAGKIKFKSEPGFSNSRSVNVFDEGGNPISTVTVGLSDWWSGTDSLLPNSVVTTLWGKDAARKRALAAERLYNRYRLAGQPVPIPTKK